MRIPLWTLPAHTTSLKQSIYEALMTDKPAYQVLARKYRPETFADLVGQDAMVRTLKNAFEGPHH